MPDSDAQPVEGVNLQTITVNAASPDVLAAVCKEITDKVMDLIPDDAFTKIAEEVLENGEIVRRNVGGYGGAQVVYSLATFAKEAVAKKLEVRATQLIGAFWLEEETQKLVQEIAAQAFAAGLKALPHVMADKFVARLVNAGCGFVPDSVVEADFQISQRLENLIQHLQYNTNVDLPPEVLNG